MNIRHIAGILLSLVLCSEGWAYTDKTVRWSEDALLHDGRTILVEREVAQTMDIRRTDPFFGLPSSPRTERGADVHSLKFRHPSTGTAVKWQGEKHYSPVLLDVVDGVAYLVLFGYPTKDAEKAYGCPELPFVCLQFDANNRGRWSVIPQEKAPAVLKLANLSLLEPGEATHLTRDQVQQGIRRSEKHNQNYFQQAIPRTYDQWKYADSEKNSYRNGRKIWDCRPPPPPRPLADVLLPKPVDVELEAVESADASVLNDKEYVRALLDRKGSATRANCTALFAPADAANSMAGERFVKDSTGSRRPPYSGPGPIRSGGSFAGPRTLRYCDDSSVWYVAEREEPGKLIITKYTVTGDFLYSARMATPRTADNNLSRRMVLDSITGERGSFYFFWEQSLPRPSATGPFLNRMTRFRFREPG